jgi:glycosyltransferase involved in cell wall biosynthesis
MKVLVISAAFPPMAAGEATNALHLCEHLAERGLDVHVLTTRGNGTITNAKFSVHPLMSRWSWREAPRLAAFVRRCAPDVVYVMYLGWTYGHQFMSTFIPTIVKRALPAARVITRFENIGGAGPAFNSLPSKVIRKLVADWDNNGAVDYQFGTLLRDSDAIILLSSRHSAILERHRANVSAKCVLIPPPANMVLSAGDPETRARGRLALRVRPDEFLIAYIGFIYPGKGLETLLQTFARLTQEFPQLRLAMIGGGLAREFPDHPSYVERLHELAETLGVGNKTIWTGEYRSDTDEASAYLRAADACVLPFDTGVKLNNSSFASVAAHGLPILTTADAALEPQFVDGENVLLCPPKSPEALGHGIRTLIADPALRERLSSGSLRLAREWYSWSTALDKTLSLFEDARSIA